MVKENKKQSALIKDIASTIISTDNLDAIIHLFLDLAMSYTGARCGSLLLYESHGTMVVKASKDTATGPLPAPGTILVNKICTLASKKKAPLLSKDLLNYNRVSTKGKGKREADSSICCPICRKDEVLGVIVVSGKRDGGPLTEADYELIEILANHTAIALKNSYLMSELISHSKELDERNKKLIDSDRLKTEFIAKMTHELRTPLNAINGAVYYLKGKHGPAVNREEFVEVISDETGKIIGLLESLLNFTSMENEEPLLNRKVINISDIIHEARESKVVKDALAAARVTLKIKSPGSLSDIVGEKIRLIQSIIHLFEGIAGCSTEGSRITLTTTEKKSAINIRINVKGRSIPEDDLPLIFDERSLWAGIEGSANKLHFYLAKKTMSQHKGQITVSNIPGGFNVLLNFPKSLKEYRDTEIEELMDLFLLFIAESMNLDKCSVMLIDELTGEMTIRSSLGTSAETVRRTSVRIGERIAGLVAAENRPLLVKDIEKAPRIGKKNIPRYSTKSLICLPIVISGKVIGVLNLSDRADAVPFDTKDLYFAMAITDRISHMIDKVQRGELQNSGFKAAIKGIEALLNAEKRAKNKKKNGRLKDLLFNTMRILKRSEDEIKLALYSSELYDLGLTQIDECILMKSDTLSDIEQKIIRAHPFPGAGLIDLLEKDNTVKDIIIHHHERYDGTGYPGRLKGDRIPFSARVLSVVDSYTAMTHDRPYRKALSSKEALKRIKAGSGSQFDPQVVQAFTETV